MPQAASVRPTTERGRANSLARRSIIAPVKNASAAPGMSSSMYMAACRQSGRRGLTGCLRGAGAKSMVSGQRSSTALISRRLVGTTKPQLPQPGARCSSSKKPFEP